MKNLKKKMDKMPKNIIGGLIGFGLCLLVLAYLISGNRDVENLSYSEFIKQIRNSNVVSVKILDNNVQGQMTDGKRFTAVIPASINSVWETMDKHNVNVEIENAPVWPNFLSYLLALLPLLLLIGLGAFYYIRQNKSAGQGGGSSIFSMTKSKAKVFMPNQIKDNFNSVAGAAEAKEELQEIVDYLKDPSKYARLGAKVSRGTLLIGEPGNGKTLLARAVAGEANCPFLSISGSDFVEMFVGVGASRVRDLFAQARSLAPCIVFIDEIDTVGRQRGTGLGGGNDEREQTLNQLLTEMDGFEDNNASVIVIAATNRPDVLDNALLRPGRFDRKVMVPYPDLKSRLEILKVHGKKIKLNTTSVDYDKLARGTVGFTGADLANLVNEAAVHASRNNKPLVDIEDFEEARDKVLLGKENKSILLTDEDKKVTAYHEAGHAIMTLLQPEETDPLHKVTIVPRGFALGVTHSMPERDKYSSSKNEMLARIRTMLGGRAAEELVFGKLMTGASNDFEKTSELVRNMICKYGMSDLGMIVYKQGDNTFKYSEDTAKKIDQEATKIVNDCYAETKKTLSEHRNMLDKLSSELIDKEVLEADEIYSLLGIEPRVTHKIS
ncbi:MAG: ATP-dependent zinc metalloprotease FtsH [candidate division TM6 bacterium GW2011_GWF2_32_72]|nr:MAG: ATP-dependent zinc metalloprotease FtsH [candidate division TM6 bacterium GW2011_GWF2_32_72]